MPLHVAEITIPGTWLVSADQAGAWRVQGLLQHLQGQLFDATVALNLFESARAPRGPRRPHHVWQELAVRRDAILRSRFAPSMHWHPAMAGDSETFEAEVAAKRELWSEGQTPTDFETLTLFLYARAFLYALDAFDKLLRVLAQEPGVPSNIQDLASRVEVRFPHLRGVRNTTQHLEDRARGLSSGQEPLQLKPVENAAISAPAGVLLLNSMINNRYGSTMSDGQYGEVEVSLDTLQGMQQLLQAVLLSFRWQGPPRHLPNA